MALLSRPSQWSESLICECRSPTHRLSGLRQIHARPVAVIVVGIGRSFGEFVPGNQIAQEAQIAAVEVNDRDSRSSSHGVDAIGPIASRCVDAPQSKSALSEGPGLQGSPFRNPRRLRKIGAAERGRT